MPLGNIVILEPGKPERMHFRDHFKGPRDITDNRTGQPTVREVLEFDVDELNGQKVSAKYSILAEKHFAQLEPYLANRAYLNYEFIITKTGSGFRTTYTTAAIPRK